MTEHARAGDFDAGAESMLDLLGDAFAPEDEEGGEDWGIPNVVHYIEGRMPEQMLIKCEIPPRSSASRHHLRGAAHTLRELAEALEERADEIRRAD